MAQYQSISFVRPKMHGNGPKRLFDVITKPSAPKRGNGVRSLKEVFRNKRGNTRNANIMYNCSIAFITIFN